MENKIIQILGKNNISVTLSHEFLKGHWVQDFLSRTKGIKKKRLMY